MEKDLVLADPTGELTETLKLTKNTKGYTWEIRLRCGAHEKVDEALIKRMQDINNKMMSHFESMPSIDNSPLKRGYRE